MVDLSFREEVWESDIDMVRALVNRSGFFSSDEVEIATSLVREHVERGLDSGYFFIFAARDDITVGYSCYGPIPGTIDGFDLYWIVVDPESQGLGIGHQLLTHTEQRISQMGGKRLYAETSSTDIYTPTRSFYGKRGFFLEGRLADYYAPGDDKMLYTKHLDF